MNQATFALKCLWKSLIQKSNCPYCGSADTRLIERKHTVLQLRRCRVCRLWFRFPKDDASENKAFYQQGYQESTVTDLPAMADIPSHIVNRFAGVGRDLTEHLRTIKAFAPEGKLLDYGSSWGYCVYQFREAGYIAQGFEISRVRVEYGRKVLNVDLTTDSASLPDALFDVIYSAHCLEHIPNPDLPMREFQRLLKPGGHLFIYVPNCGGDEAERLGVGWGPMIGEKHVLALTAGFFHANLPRYGFELLFASSPYTAYPKCIRIGQALRRRVAGDWDAGRGSYCGQLTVVPLNVAVQLELPPEFGIFMQVGVDMLRPHHITNHGKLMPPANPLQSDRVPHVSILRRWVHRGRRWRWA